MQDAGGGGWRWGVETPSTRKGARWLTRNEIGFFLTTKGRPREARECWEVAGVDAGGGKNKPLEKQNNGLPPFE